MTLTYIYHSCFVVHNEHLSIIFDYYKDSPDAWIQKHILSFKGKIYVMCSHSHHDHFNERVLHWKVLNPDIQYIFSKDILDEGYCKAHDAVFLNKFETYQDDLISVKAYGSTDLGISFAVEADGKRIFHAGDLNNWHWKDESTPEEVSEAEQFYLAELDALANDYSMFDVAMFPVDPRLGSDYSRGAIQFLERINVKLFAPMHFWEKYEEANKFQKITDTFGSKFFTITKEGDSVRV